MKKWIAFPVVIFTVLFGLGLASAVMAGDDPLVRGTNCTLSSPYCDFPETGNHVEGAFWNYWKNHGGLAQQGYPISPEHQEVSTDGNPYTTQYFERAVFEYHPENVGTEFEVLLRLMGSEHAATHDWETVDGLRRIESPEKWFPLYKGQAAFGTKIMIQDRILCDGHCYTSNMPENGQVFNGVGHPWRSEIVGWEEAGLK